MCCRAFLHHGRFAPPRCHRIKRLLGMPPLDKKFSACDRVTLRRTGITTSRLAMKSN